MIFLVGQLVRQKVRSDSLDFCFGLYLYSVYYELRVEKPFRWFRVMKPGLFQSQSLQLNHSLDFVV